MNEVNTASVANVAAKGTIPPVISFAKQAISGTQQSRSAAVCQEKTKKKKKIVYVIQKQQEKKKGKGNEKSVKDNQPQFPNARSL